MNTARRVGILTGYLARTVDAESVASSRCVRDANRRDGASKAGKRRDARSVAVKRANKIARIIQALDKGVVCAADIELSEGARVQEETVREAIEALVKASNSTRVVDASSLSKNSGIVRLDKRGAKCSGMEADVAAVYAKVVSKKAGDVAPVLLLDFGFNCQAFKKMALAQG